MRVESISKAEIGDYDVAIPIQQKVLKFQISMNDALIV